jgi:2-polyprenyl-3-methyl-5-hydroxy-6-metoxy-1,4-benzoquinol methylase
MRNPEIRPRETKMVDSPQELSDQVKRLMDQPQIHDSWEKVYRAQENEKFFELAYDDLVKQIQQSEGSCALDIGCGICANSIRLARRGYIVSAGDYSESILTQARENVARNRLAERITVNREDILNLSFPTNHFDLVLCWGVLMHIPNAQLAIAELARVAKPGGFLVLEEINQDSLEARLLRLVWKTLSQKKITLTKTAAGYEQTCTFASETLFWRHVNPRWLIDQFASHSCNLVNRSSSLFSEIFRYMPAKFFGSAVHAWNRFWLRRFNRPRPAYHNIFIFRKVGCQSPLN